MKDYPKHKLWMMKETQTPEFVRGGLSLKQHVILQAVQRPLAVVRELNNRFFYHFLKYFWPLISAHDFKGNWHIEYLCEQLMDIAERVGAQLPKKHDVVINVPPGSTKTITCSIMFPIWCWTRWPWMKFICASYSRELSLESADFAREILRSKEFREVYPELSIKDDKDTKGNFRIEKLTGAEGTPVVGGTRFSTSVGGTLMGFHGDIIIVDDPINPKQAASDLELATANRWMEQTLPTRKTNKVATPTILIMQRLHQNDPTGNFLKQNEKGVFHICLPGEIYDYRDKVRPKELVDRYVDNLLDPVRLPLMVLQEMKLRLGQYGYAGQVGQNPTPPGGGMFQVGKMEVLEGFLPDMRVLHTIRYWDKAGTQDGGAYTAGVRMSVLGNGQFVVEDVVRGQWAPVERERMIRSIAMSDGHGTVIWIEQEPGSGGKESAEATIRNLAGFVVYAERPSGDKIFRADPYSVQVNNRNVKLLSGGWNDAFIDEHRFFPFSQYKDQVDAASGAFNKLATKRLCRRIT